MISLATHVVSDVEQAADENAVALGALALHVLARGANGHQLRHESALGADRHDQGVLDVLRLHETENFGAEILAPVGPAQAAARDLAHAQVHAFDARRVHPDLVHRARLWQLGQQLRVELEREVRLGQAVRAALIVVGAQRGHDHRTERAQDAVVVGAGDFLERFVDVRGKGCNLRRSRCRFQVGIEA